MSVVRKFFGGAMNLAQSVQDFVQAGRSLFAAFKWLLLLPGREPLNPALTTVLSGLSSLF